MRFSRAKLLVGVSLVVLSAFADPRGALAACTGLNQTISSPTTGPVLSTGGAITITTSGSVTGTPGQPGVLLTVCPATTIGNSGAIKGGANGSIRTEHGTGGAGVSNSSTIKTLSNTGAIAGGSGSASSETFGVGVGGAGVSNSDTIRALSNSGAISGGVGSGFSGTGGAGVSNFGTIKTLANKIGGTITGGSEIGGVILHGGAGVSNSGMITSLTNGGTIAGGVGYVTVSGGGYGGAGVSNAGTITRLTNTGTISGGAAGGSADAAGAGVSNSGTITKLTNSGTISGGSFTRATGVSNSGTIATLTNSGTITKGRFNGNAILSQGAGASIGTIANSGSIVGNVEIDNQSNVTITGVIGGGGKAFGSLTGGTIVISNGNLTFGRGHTFLGDNVEVNGGDGTVYNRDPLRIAASLTITGNYDQTADGALDFGALTLDLAGDAWGQYGALTITKLATLDGGLGIDLTNGFTLATGDSFDILNFGGLAGPGFNALTLNGAACSSTAADIWTCGGGVRLNEVIAAASLDLVVAHGDPAGSSPIPEPSTWAMLAIGFLGLGGLGLRKHKKAGEIGLR